MNDKIAITSFTVSLITFLIIIAYPAGTVKTPYIPVGTLTCNNSTFTTTFAPPTTISSNAILGPSYTYYFSDVIVINGQTCRVSGKVSFITIKKQ